MKKIIKIKGMSCLHCANKVKAALESEKDLKAKIDLKNNLAVIKLKTDISNEELITRVTKAGYTVEEIENI